MLQIANFGLPLVTLPYLTRVLGLESFGLVVLVQAVLQYFVLLTGWGFSWSATRKLSAHRAEQSVVDDIYSATWAAQWLLLAGSACVLLLATVFLSTVRQHASLYAWGFTAVLGNVLFPVWLLQGLEKIKAVAIAQLLARVSILPAYFLFIHETDDAIWVIALNGGAPVLAGFFTLYWIYRTGIARWKTPSFKRVLAELCESAMIFSSQTWISLYTTTIPIILGAVAGTAAVGIFNLADKFRSAGTAVLAPLSTALFPRLSYLFEHDQPQARHLLRKSGIVLITCAAAGGLVLYFGANLIISMFGGFAFQASASVLRWLSPLPLIIVLSNIFGVQIMLPLKKHKAFSLILATAGAISLLIMTPLIAWKGAQGAAITILITELCVTVGMAVHLQHTGFFRKNKGNKYES